MNKQQFSSFIRTLGLSGIADKTRFHLVRYFKRKENKLFRQNNPGVVLPPDYLIYESFQMNYHKYFIGGKEDALWLVELLQKHGNITHASILDWGCGPARIIRHLPSILGPSNTYVGTDYNPVTIEWNRKNIPGVRFELNGLNPPTSFQDNEFDFIYGISVFTHLSMENHERWTNELWRIAKEGAIILLTTSGNAFKEKLTDEELIQFNAGQLVTRGKVKEGHRMYSAFHPPSFLKSLFEKAGFVILEHIPGERKTVTYISQDMWVLKKSVRGKESKSL